MEIQSLCAAHLPQMAGLLRANYDDEKRWLPTLPEYRGRGIMDGLLDYVRATLATEDFQYLGVDCETMNPNALYYWPKHFRVYTYNLTRRVDEGILSAAHES